MNFKSYLIKQMESHPSMEAQDVAKMCYQATYGAEHLLKDMEGAKAYLKKELDETKAAESEQMYEQISDNVCRVNLSSWKAAGLPAEWLFKLFAASTSVSDGTKEQQKKYLFAAEELVKEGVAGVSLEQWKAFMAEYEKKGMPAVHHSESYRKNENPAYRIVQKQLVRLIPILQAAAKHMQSNSSGAPCIIAIDGRAASGKSTMAGQLAKVLECDVVEMDDFFLPVELRTQERLDAAGGNVHWERFAEEVLTNLSERKSFEYGIFDCSQLKISGVKKVEMKDFIVVEGSYSCHPEFGDYAHIRVFSDVDAGEQMRRIQIRNGKEMAEIFEARWIPMEEKYFKTYNISEKAHLKLI